MKTIKLLALITLLISFSATGNSTPQEVQIDREGEPPKAELIERKLSSLKQPTSTSGIVPMVPLPPGSFVMGRNHPNVGIIPPDYSEADLPLTDITIDYRLLMGKFEVTHDQYTNVLNWAIEHGHLSPTFTTNGDTTEVYHNNQFLYEIPGIKWNGRSFGTGFKGATPLQHYPVQISYHGAISFCNYLSLMENRTPAYDLTTWSLSNRQGGGYRLPSESEWEYACRGSVDNPNRYGVFSFLSFDYPEIWFDWQCCTVLDDCNLGLKLINPFGRLPDHAVDRYMVWCGNSDGDPSPVGTRFPNDYGLYDMHGNAAELCEDIFTPTYAGSMPTDGSPRLEPSEHGRIVFRGGSCKSPTGECYTALRTPLFIFGAYLGFRIVRVDTQPLKLVDMQHVLAELDLRDDFDSHDDLRFDPADLVEVGRNRSVRGIAADGVSRLLVRIGPFQADGKFTMRIADELDNYDARTTGRLLTPVQGEALGSEEQQELFEIGPNPGEFYGFAWYEAPMDFVRDEVENDLNIGGSVPRILTLTCDLDFEDETSQEIEHEIELYRPPVVLLHGLFDAAESWSWNLKHKKEAYRVFVPDYSSTNSASLRTNVYKIRHTIIEILHEVRKHGIACSQIDAFGHSMGGMILRMFSVADQVYRHDFEFEDAKNLWKGYYHKLITVRSPHLGSQAADLMSLEDKDLLELEGPRWVGNATYLLQLIRSFDPFGAPCSINDTRGRAANDMRTDSPLLKRFNQTEKEIPIHLMVGSAGDTEDSGNAHECLLGNTWAQDKKSVMNNFFVKLFLFSNCAFTGQDNTPSLFYQGQNDLAVSLRSQLAGFSTSDSFVTLTNTGDGESLHWPAISEFPNGVGNFTAEMLINASIEGGLFRKEGFKKVEYDEPTYGQCPPPVPMPDRPVYGAPISVEPWSINPFPHVKDAHKINNVEYFVPGQAMICEYDEELAAVDIDWKVLFSTGNIQEVQSEGNSFRFMIPEEALGTIEGLAIGNSEDLTWYVADFGSINIASSEFITAASVVVNGVKVESIHPIDQMEYRFDRNYWSEVVQLEFAYEDGVRRRVELGKLVFPHESFIEDESVAVLTSGGSVYARNSGSTVLWLVGTGEIGSTRVKIQVSETKGDGNGNGVLDQEDLKMLIRLAQQEAGSEKGVQGVEPSVIETFDYTFDGIISNEDVSAFIETWSEVGVSVEESGGLESILYDVARRWHSASETPEVDFSWVGILASDGLDAADLVIILKMSELAKSVEPLATPVPIPTPTPTTLSAPIITVDLRNLAEGARPLRLVRIPAGTFNMGSPDTERSRDADEGPVHSVTISRDFYIGETEITQAQWLAVTGEIYLGDATSGYIIPGDDRPIAFVRWNDISAEGGFLDQLNQLAEQAGYRLPSEAEWEYACRGGTNTRFSFGDSLGCNDESENCETDGLFGFRSMYMWYSWYQYDGSNRVAQKLPNQYNLYDMHGNVSELVMDRYDSSFYEQPAAGEVDPVNDDFRDGFRVYRGGSRFSSAKSCRSAERTRLAPTSRLATVGFRIALTSSD